MKSRFLLTLNMPARSGQMVHQVTCEHYSEDIDTFTEMMNNWEFIVVEELYRDKEGQWYSVGPLSLNTAVIGKVKQVQNSFRPHDERE
jgi:hypothetical protein